MRLFVILVIIFVFTVTKFFNFDRVAFDFDPGLEIAYNIRTVKATKIGYFPLDAFVFI
jgi:hypothetical protein